jgi:hypothetical protein
MASFGAWGFSDWLCATAKALEQNIKQTTKINRMRSPLDLHLKPAGPE